MPEQKAIISFCQWSRYPPEALSLGLQAKAGAGRAGHGHAGPNTFFLPFHRLATSCRAGPLHSPQRQGRQTRPLPLACPRVLCRSNTPPFPGRGCLASGQQTPQRGATPDGLRRARPQTERVGRRAFGDAGTLYKPLCPLSASEGGRERRRDCAEKAGCYAVGIGGGRM